MHTVTWGLQAHVLKPPPGGFSQPFINAQFSSILSLLLFTHLFFSLQGCCSSPSFYLLPALPLPQTPPPRNAPTQQPSRPPPPYLSLPCVLLWMVPLKSPVTPLATSSWARFKPSRVTSTSSTRVPSLPSISLVWATSPVLCRSMP